MIKLECEAIVTYTCCLTEDSEEKVNNYYYKHKNDEEFIELSKEKIIKEIVNKLYNNDEIDDLYYYSTESDFNTNYIGVKEIK